MRTKKWLNAEYTKKRRSLKEIAIELKISEATLSRDLEKFKIKSRTPAESNTHVKINKRLLRREYLHKRTDINEILSIFNISHTTFRRKLEEFKIPNRGTNLNFTHKFLHKEYVKLKKSIDLIAIENKSTRIIITRHLNLYNIKLRTPAESNKLDIKITKRWLYKEYVINKRTTLSISLEKRTSETVIRRYMKEFKIKFRSPHEYSNRISNLHKDMLIPLLEKYKIKHKTSHILPKLIGQPPTAQPYEIDEFLPDHKIFLELYGDYWHNLPKRKESYKRRHRLLKQHFPNIKLVIIWEKELKSGIGEKIIKSLIMN